MTEVMDCLPAAPRDHCLGCAVVSELEMNVVPAVFVDPVVRLPTVTPIELLNTCVSQLCAAGRKTMRVRREASLTQETHWTLSLDMSPCKHVVDAIVHISQR